PKEKGKKRDFLCIFLHIRQESAVAFLFHVLFGDEAQGCTVDAVAHAAQFCGTIVEYMSQMGIAYPAADFRTNTVQRKVIIFVDGIGVNGLGESRPAAGGNE